MIYYSNIAKDKIKKKGGGILKYEKDIVGYY